METKITGIQLLKLPESVQKQRKATHSVILSIQNFDAQTQKLLISVDNKISEINPKTKEAELTIKEKPKNELQNVLASVATYRVKGHIVDPETTKISGSVLQEFHSQVQGFQHTKADGLHKTSDVILGDYKEILEKWEKEIQEKPEILQLFFAKLSLEAKEGEKPRRKIESVDTAKLGDELYIVCKTKNMQGKKVRVYVRQGRQDSLGRTDENVELFMNTGFSTSMEMTVGKEASQNQYSNSGQLKDYAYGKIKLIPKETVANSDENFKKWQEILKNTQDHQTFLYIYAEMVEDTSVFLNDSKNEDFLVINGEDIEKKEQSEEELKENIQVIGSLINDTNGVFYTYEGKFLDKNIGKKKGSSDDVYACSSKSEKGFENSNKLKINHDDFQRVCNIIKHEGQSNEENEYIFIAHANYNEAKNKEVTMLARLMTGYSSVDIRDKRSLLPDSAVDPLSKYSRKGLIDALLRDIDFSKPDPTDGARFWDGVDFLAWGIDTELKADSNSKTGHNKFDEYNYVKIRKDLYDKFVTRIKTKFPNGVPYGSSHNPKTDKGSHVHKKTSKGMRAIYKIPSSDFNKKEYWATGDFYYKNKEKRTAGIIATQVAGYSIFWKEIK